MFKIIICSVIITNLGLQAKFSKQELAEILMPFFKGKISTENFRLKIENVNFDLEKLNNEINEENIEDIIISADQRKFELKINTSKSEKFSISGKVEWLVNVAVVLRPISTNDIINASDVGTNAYPVDELKPDTILEPKDLVGKTAVSTVIKPLIPVEKFNLKNPIVVKKGNIVEVVYSKANLCVSTKATATQDLALGDCGVFETLKMDKNATTKRIAAQVKSTNIAEVVHG